MQYCLQCDAPLVPVEFSCVTCGLSYRGRFPQPRLARLGPAEQRLAEQLVLAGGNLKALARELGVSYPTARKRVAALQERLRALAEADRVTIDGWLDGVENGTLAAGEAARCIAALNGTE